MSIILAIEPDRRQAAQLTGIVRQRVGAELILAATTELALDAIGSRIPDMVLVPAFLSPQDDAALAAALRVIAAAAHVRTLTIPLLSSGERRPAPGGILAKWRRARASSPTPDGCDPAVFAEQITAYLKEAAAERAELEPDEPVEMTPSAATPVETALLENAEILVITSTAPTFVLDGIPSVDVARRALDETAILDAVAVPVVADETAAVEEAARVPTVAEAFVIEETVPVFVVHETSAVDVARRALDETAILDAVAIPPVVDEAIVIEATPVTVLEEVPDEATVPAPADALFTEVELVPALEEAMVEFLAEEEFPAEEAERPREAVVSWTGAYLTPGQMWPVLAGIEVEARPQVDEHPPEPEPVAARPRHLEWTELVASLRQDIERRRAEAVATSTPRTAVRALAGDPSLKSRPDPRPKRRGKKAKPAQDEWGFFDPEQCGFAALLAKLEEITVNPDLADDGDAGRPA